jgi:hypothetical protein
MTRGTRWIFVAIGLTPFSARAQACTPSARALFEFQVETPATYIPDSTISPRPYKEQRGARDPDLMLRIETLWESREALSAMRGTGTPRGVLIFREAGAEPVLSVFDLVEELKPERQHAH